MYILKSETNNAYFNLALGEYFLKNYNEDFFVIYTNEPSIVLGVNQNAYEEVNALYVKQSSIKLARRLSGGGSIFQDYGNLNFSYIYKDNEKSLKVTEILAGFLKDKLDSNVKFIENKHLLIEGKKIGGYTKLKADDKILLHSSIIFSSNEKFLIDAFKLGKSNYPDRALRSSHAKVTSISEHLSEEMNMDKFKGLFYNYIRSIFPDAEIFELSEKDKDNINTLIKEKYSTWEWTYGKELPYNYKNVYNSKAGKIEILIDIDRDIIKNIYFRGDFFSQKDIKELENIFRNISYDKQKITELISSVNINNYIENINPKEFINHFFK